MEIIEQILAQEVNWKFEKSNVSILLLLRAPSLPPSTFHPSTSIILGLQFASSNNSHCQPVWPWYEVSQNCGFQ